MNKENQTLTIGEIKTRVLQLGRKYGLKRIYLFGSYARGNANENSDVDLRVDFEKPMGAFKFAGLYLELKEAFGKEVDLLSTDSLSSQFLNAIKPYEVLIYGK